MVAHALNTLTSQPLRAAVALFPVAAEHLKKAAQTDNENKLQLQHCWNLAALNKYSSVWVLKYINLSSLPG